MDSRNDYQMPTDGDDTARKSNTFSWNMFLLAIAITMIGFSLVVVVIAALNLVLDFDFIESGADRNAPKYMEWYGAYGLMLSMIWM